MKIADFGLAKLLGADAAADQSHRHPAGDGHAALHGPRAVEGAERSTTGPTSIRSVVFYELLTGELAAGPLSAARRDGAEVDVRLDEVVLKTLEREPERRYQHASEVKPEVEAYLATACRSCLSPRHHGASPRERHRPAGYVAAESGMNLLPAGVDAAGGRAISDCAVLCQQYDAG